jgi:hypothetical protein
MRVMRRRKRKGLKWNCCEKKSSRGVEHRGQQLLTEATLLRKPRQELAASPNLPSWPEITKPLATSSQ